uniref:Uncharacterized protein n=1 Tax=Rhipicephalus zambeziensis TaxID=60191 RepID=A0A224YLX3_9ACAR
MLFGRTVVNYIRVTVGNVISSLMSFSWCKRALLSHISLCGLFRVLYTVYYLFSEIHLRWPLMPLCSACCLPFAFDIFATPAHRVSTTKYFRGEAP